MSIPIPKKTANKANKCPNVDPINLFVFSLIANLLIQFACNFFAVASSFSSFRVHLKIEYSVVCTFDRQQETIFHGFHKLDSVFNWLFDHKFQPLSCYLLCELHIKIETIRKCQPVVRFAFSATTEKIEFIIQMFVLNSLQFLFLCG